MTVKDISLNGVGIEIYENLDLSVGDVLDIEFRLDDSSKTLIKREVTIRNINNSYIGTEFLKTQIENKALGFYLMP